MSVRLSTTFRGKRDCLGPQLRYRSNSFLCRIPLFFSYTHVQLSVEHADITQLQSSYKTSRKTMLLLYTAIGTTHDACCLTKKNTILSFLLKEILLRQLFDYLNIHTDIHTDKHSTILQLLKLHIFYPTIWNPILILIKGYPIKTAVCEISMD